MTFLVERLGRVCFTSVAAGFVRGVSRDLLRLPEEVVRGGRSEP
jgi:hypothetical protein